MRSHLRRRSRRVHPQGIRRRLARIAACRLIDSGESQLFTPEGWKYEKSLSRTYGLVPDGQTVKSLRFLRRDGSVDVYLNAMTGKEVYIGRTRDSKADDACECA